MGSRIFTPASARRSLQEIRPSVERMTRLVRRMRRVVPRVAAADQPVDPSYFALLRRLTRTMERVARTGARIRDPGRGLIEFPARRSGRTVLLSWKLGEPGIAHWREIGSDDVERHPFDDDGPWEEGL